MHYTIDKLLLDEGSSLDPNKYNQKGPIAKELVGFLTAHLGDRSWKVGVSTELGPHSFLLALNPTADTLRFWKSAKFNNWKIRMGCNGTLEVWDHSLTKMVPPEKPPEEPKTEKQIKDAMETYFRTSLKRLNR